MPRTATSTELSVLGDKSRRVSPVRVEIQNADDTWKDLTNLSGTGFSNLDFFKRGSITDDSDAPTWTGTIELAESQIAASGASISLAPDVETSPANVDDSSAYAPLIDGMRRIRIYATTGRLSGADATEHKMFDGYVVSSEQQDGITLQIADLGHLLLTTQVEDQRIYGSDDGVLLQDVIQQILDDNMGVGVIPLVTDAAIISAGVMVKKFDFGRPRLLTGIRDLAINTIGANVKYRWNGEDMELTLFMPPRGNTTPDFTFGADNYERKARFARNTEDVRNAGRLYYRDRDKKTVVYVAADVPDSITRYKRRYFEFREAATSQIDTESEAKTMLDTALSDLAFPKAEKSFTTLFAWPFQVYDLFQMTGNAKQYTTDQLQAVQRITHTWGDAKSTRTAFETRGTIAGYTKNWLIREGEGPRAPEVDSLFVVTGVVAEDSMYGGELFDGEVNGCVWVGVYVGKGIRRIHGWGRENAPGTLVTEWPPVGSDIYKAFTIERPEGALVRGNYTWPTTNPDDPYGGVLFWRTYIPVPTGRNADGTMRALIIKPETEDGTFGDEVREAAAAVDDGISAEPGDFTSISITRIDATTVRVTAVLPDDIGLVFFFRDGVNIDQRPSPTGGGTVTWDDTELKAEKGYAYSVFRFNGSKSGPRTRVNISPWGTSFAFATGTPTTDYSFGGPRVKIDYTGAPPGTVKIGVRKSKDAGQYDPWTEAARLNIANFPYYDAIVKAGQYYQLVAYGSGDAVLDKTLPFFWRSPLPLVTGAS